LTSYLPPFSTNSLSKFDPCATFQPRTMTRSFQPAWPCLALLLSVALTSRSFALTVEEEHQRHFAQKVLPLLKEKCLACHGDDPKKLKGSFDMRTREGMLKDGESD